MLAGARLHATVLAVGLLLRFDWITLPAAWQQTSVLADADLDRRRYRVRHRSGPWSAVEASKDLLAGQIDGALQEAREKAHRR